ncbi:hypothetical protein, partial [Klebsiella pneumoniae]|uniref:hypothetical protein n=1 Tax=Klebsiella pneumoniae TaxID=573 RepID=UPI00197C8DC4
IPDENCRKQSGWLQDHSPEGVSQTEEEQHGGEEQHHHLIERVGARIGGIDDSAQIGKWSRGNPE